jgi:hypothetical protein
MQGGVDVGVENKIPFGLRENVLLRAGRWKCVIVEIETVLRNFQDRTAHAIRNTTHLLAVARDKSVQTESTRLVFGRLGPLRRPIPSTGYHFPSGVWR